jgi:hypothetical protein
MFQVLTMMIPSICQTLSLAASNSQTQKHFWRTP